MDTLDAIFTRKSTRRFTEQPVEQAVIHTILQAGMSGPTCVNARDWEFIVVTERRILERMAEANGKPAEPLRRAAFGILLCGSLDRAFPPAQDYWIIDAAIAGQNMILAAQAQGVGSVWLGTWPQMERVEKLSELFHLPANVMPHSILAFGYPTEKNTALRNQYEAEKVHFEKW